MFTTDVENYPGFPEGVDGPGMMEAFRKQSERFGTRILTEDVTEVNFEKRPFVLKGNETNMTAHAVIIATGATARWLGLPSEQRLKNKGVSACAVCDGALPMFRDQPLVVVGGGDSAMEESTYLSKFASKVYVIHRRDELRASHIMQDRVFENSKIEIVWNSVVEEVLGEDQVTGVRIKNKESGETSEIDCKGMFLAIGHDPSTKIFRDYLDTDENGYIITKPGKSHTSVEGVFAAGDVKDSHYRQAVTAAGMGCMAALDAERWLGSQGLI